MISPRFQFDAQAFLVDCWQKKPKLIKSAIPGFQSPITPEELGGLAMEPEADARIVSLDEGGWSLEHGPFNENDFQRKGKWSLLVQRVDEWFPEVMALRGCVDFLPQWRFDDIMVSYATDGAGVGPHFDRYDVFLLQGAGQRRWKIGPKCDSTTPTVSDSELCLIDEFEPTDTFLLNPGDVLYVPPGFAHWGEAVGESMTYSLGFRAPRVTDLIARLSDRVIDRLEDELLLEDKDSMKVQPRPGEILSAHTQNARQAVLNALKALDTDDDWYAELLSDLIEPPEQTNEPVANFVELNPSQRMLWRENEDHIAAYLGGERYQMRLEDESLLCAICAGEVVEIGRLDDFQSNIIKQWWSLGFLEERFLNETH